MSSDWTPFELAIVRDGEEVNRVPHEYRVEADGLVHFRLKPGTEQASLRLASTNGVYDANLRVVPMSEVQWAHRLGAEAVEAIPKDAYCPAGNGKQRKCPDCISRAAVNAVTEWLGNEGRLEGEGPWTA